MKDEIVEKSKVIDFPIDYNPNDILMAQAREFWNSISEEQHMREHEIMMINIAELAKEDLEWESRLEVRKN